MDYMIHCIKNNTIFSLVCSLLLLIFISSCSYIKSINQPIVKIEYQREFDKTDHIPIFEIGDEIPEHYAILGEIYVRSGDYNMQESCIFESALDKLIVKSMNMGGDAVKIITIKGPDEQNICFRITGLSLSYNQ